MHRNHCREHLHPTTISSHRSLVMCFRIKSLLPVAFAVPPLILKVISIAIVVPHELATFIFSLSGWMPLLDGVLSIYYVLPYRRAVIHFVVSMSHNRKKLCMVTNNKIHSTGIIHAPEYHRAIVSADNPNIITLVVNYNRW
uniref:G protein-coupled receptor n=1 Tax=Ascaris lumbricoides TaxID=6252 RepID=A0A0M3HU11_ASCLU